MKQKSFPRPNDAIVFKGGSLETGFDNSQDSNPGPEDPGIAKV